MSGIPMYFYNGEQVHNLRFFKIDKVVFAEFKIGEELFVDKASALSTSRPEIIRDEKVEAAEIPEVQNTEPVEPETETETEAPSMEPEPEPEEVTDEATEDTEVQRVVTATNIGNNETIELIDNDELEIFANEHKLDKEAIERVIAGEQKTHKGFSFKVTN